MTTGHHFTEIEVRLARKGFVETASGPLRHDTARAAAILAAAEPVQEPHPVELRSPRHRAVTVAFQAFLPGEEVHPPAGMATALYVYFDGDDLPLYVGISDNLRSRRATHLRKSTWRLLAVRAETRWFHDRALALDAERKMIEAREPLFNRIGNTAGWERRLVQYLIERDRLDLLSAKAVWG